MHWVRPGPGAAHRRRRSRRRPPAHMQKLDKLPEAKQQALLKELTADMQEAKT